MQATTTLPPDYGRQASFNLLKSNKTKIGVIIFGIVLLIFGGWLLVQFTHFLRPNVLESIRFRHILTVTQDGQPSFTLPIVDIVVAVVLVTFIHELVHAVFCWWFAGQRPTIGFKGLFVYVAAPPEVYFPRNQYIIVSIAPLVLLTIVGLLLMLIVPVTGISILSFFIIFNIAGSAVDLIMAIRLLFYSSDTFMQRGDTDLLIFGPEDKKAAA